MKAFTTLTMLLVVAVLAACAAPQTLVPNQSTIVEMRTRVGKPTDIRFDRNGDELWEYATGPEGTETYLVRVGLDGKVKEVRQILTDEELMKIVPGKMTKADVKHILGQPSDQTFTGAGTVWSWRFKKGGIQPGHLLVTFNPDNTVKERISIIDMPGGPRMGGDK